MRKPKWYNWTGNPYWDEYCKVTGLFILLPLGSFLIYIIGGVIFGWVEVV